MTGDPALLYVEFYDEQIGRTEELERQRLAIAIALLVVLAVLLVFLGSPPKVWLGVFILYSAAYYGLSGVTTALGYTTAALRDLSSLASFVREPRSREEVFEWALAHVKADDSNVPEALRDLCAVQGGAGTTRVAANAAFTQPASQLSRTYFLRTALVLGGLFGTVFFFAVELGNDALLTGSLKTLLPGLKGALACTLTGILGSLSLGYFGSEIDGLIERSTWETEAFLGGPIAAILQRIPEVEAVNEVQLWSLLIEEVKKLRTDTAESYAKMGNDAAAYAVALQTVSNQLADLPAIQVPAQLADLQTVVRDFHGGTKVLDGAVTSLVNAVGAVGLYFPSATIERLQAIETTLQTAHEAGSQQLTSLAQAVDKTNSGVNAAMSNLSQAATSIRDVESSLDSVSRLSRTHSERLEATLGVATATAEALAKTGDRIERIPDRTAAELKNLFIGDPRIAKTTSDSTITPSAVPRTDVGATASEQSREAEISTLDRSPEERGAEITAAVAVLDEAQAEFKSQANHFAIAAQKLETDQATLAKILQSVEELRSVVKWHERASNAPLMKLLLMPFRNARQPVKTNAP